MENKPFPKEWRMVKLSDLGEVNRGHSRHRPRYAEHLYGGPYPFVQTGDIRESGGRITSHQQTYSEAGLAQSRLWPAGTMCITIAANIAETAILTYPACFPDSVVGFIADSRKCNVAFIEYTFRHLRKKIQQEANGSVQDNINLATLEQLLFPLPTLREQQTIANILGNLDDKIELNRKMSETLEAMARALFKSWFVDFDPVRAKAGGRAPSGMDAETAKLFPSEFVVSELGEIPKGWSVGNVGDVASNRRDTAHPNRITAGSAYVGLEHIPRGRIFLNDMGAPDKLESLKTRFDKDDILFGKLRPYFKKVALAPSAGICSTDILVLVPKYNARAFTLLFAASDTLIDHAVAHSNGTKMPRTSWEQITRFAFAIPSTDLLDAFEQACDSLFARAESARVESATLAQIRDLLLPRLLSGELDIGDFLREAEVVL